MAPRRGKDYWLCYGQDGRDKTKMCGYFVPCGTKACDACGHMPPLHVSCPSKRGAEADKAASGRERQSRDRRQGSGGGGAGGKRGRAGADEGADKGGAGGGKEGKEVLELRAALKKTQQELQAVKATPATPAATATSEEEATVGTELMEQRRLLRELEKTPEDVRQEIPNFGKILEDKRTRVRALDERRRNLRPADEQLKQSQAHLKDLQGRHAKDAKALEESEQQLVELQAKIIEQRTKAAASAAEVHRLKAEVATKLAAAAGTEGQEAAAVRATPTAARTTFSKEHIRAMEKVLLQVDPAKLGPEAQQTGVLITDIVSAIRAVAVDDDDEDAEELDSMDIQVSDEQVLQAIEQGGFTEGQDFANAEPEAKDPIRSKACRYIKGQLKAAADKRKTVTVLRTIATKAKKAKAGS